VITGVHTLLFAEDAERARAFLRDVLGWSYVIAHENWLIFKAPPGEIAVHPVPAGHQRHELWLMCDDVETTRRELEAKGVRFTRDIRDDGFGLTTTFEVPGAGEMSLYEPRHPTAAY
jgi:catechol 2,3-dioxygenase-like lactoylglutathione lyase family enzyme